MELCVFSKGRKGIFSEAMKSICCLLFWKTNRKRLMCLLEDISASLFLVSAPSLLDLDGRKKYIHSGNLENGVYFFSPVFSGTESEKYLLCNCQQSPSKRASFVSSSLHFPEPTNICNQETKATRNLCCNIFWHAIFYICIWTGPKYHYDIAFISNFVPSLD